MRDTTVTITITTIVVIAADAVVAADNDSNLGLRSLGKRWLIDQYHYYA